MTVWAVNQSKKEVSLKITTKDHSISDKTVTETRWTNPEEVEGHETKLVTNSNKYITVTIPANSVCCYELKVK